ncbi:MAG: ribonuclease III [Polyangiaceae bacterium]
MPKSLEDVFGPLEALAFGVRALTHPSHANEQGASADVDADYNRLEFLGDAVLALLVSEELMRRYPDAREGELSQLRAHVVSTEPLAAFARSIDLGPRLRLGRGAAASKERERDAVLADAVEALVGALYLERGLEGTRAAVHAILDAGLASPRSVRDSKSQFQERVQAAGRSTPTYRLVGSEGPDHARVFNVEVLVESEVCGRGAGASKKAAEQRAAADALSRWGA